jgi:hypothetical protein
MPFATIASTLVISSLLVSISSGLTLVTFGDSYTDQSRSKWEPEIISMLSALLIFPFTVSTFFGGSYPAPHYTEIYPPAVDAANGGTSWVRYVEMYSGVKVS